MKHFSRLFFQWIVFFVNVFDLLCSFNVLNLVTVAAIVLILNGKSSITQLLITPYSCFKTLRDSFSRIMFYVNIVRFVQNNVYNSVDEEYFQWTSASNIYISAVFDSAYACFCVYEAKLQFICKHRQNDSKRHMCHFVSSTFACKHFRRYFYINYYQYDRFLFKFKTNFSLQWSKYLPWIRRFFSSKGEQRRKNRKTLAYVFD